MCMVVCVHIIYPLHAAAAKSLQSSPTLCNPTDGSPSGFSVPGILQAITLEWVTISFSNAWKWKLKVKLLSCVQLFATPWTAAYQAPPFIGFSRQEYWSGVPVPSPHPLHGSAQMSLEVESCLMLQIRAQAANALILALWYPKKRIQLNRTSDLENREIKIHVTLSFQVYSKTIMQQ